MANKKNQFRNKIKDTLYNARFSSFARYELNPSVGEAYSALVNAGREELDLIGLSQ